MAVEQIRPDRRPEQWCGPRRKILMSAQGLRFFSESPAALLVLLFQHHATSEMRGCLRVCPTVGGYPSPESVIFRSLYLAAQFIGRKSQTTAGSGQRCCALRRATNGRPPLGVAWLNRSFTTEAR